MDSITFITQVVFSNEFMSILKNSILPLASVIGIELFRYNYISNNKDNKSAIYGITFLSYAKTPNVAV